MLGPLLAFGLLAARAGRFDAVFVVSFCFAVIGLGVLVLLVRRPARSTPAGARTVAPVTLRPTAGSSASRAFRRTLHRRHAASRSPRSATRSSTSLLAAPRRLRPVLLPAALRRLGRRVHDCWPCPPGGWPTASAALRVFLAGYVLLARVYLGLLLGPLGGTAVSSSSASSLLGAYYAATDGVLMAHASTVAPRARLRATGLALLATATSLGAARRLAGLRRDLGVGRLDDGARRRTSRRSGVAIVGAAARPHDRPADRGCVGDSRSGCSTVLCVAVGGRLRRDRRARPRDAPRRPRPRGVDLAARPAP